MEGRRNTAKDVRIGAGQSGELLSELHPILKSASSAECLWGAWGSGICGWSASSTSEIWAPIAMDAETESLVFSILRPKPHKSLILGCYSPTLGGKL
jgi:hypothetical protein